MPPELYEYSSSRVNVQGVTAPLPPNPIPSTFPTTAQMGSVRRRFRYAVVDSSRMFLTPLWESSNNQLDFYSNKTVAHHNKNDLPLEPFNDLKVLSNGTFNLSSSTAAGHLVGYEYNDTTLRFDKKSYIWANPGTHDRRWYFGILPDGSFDIDKGSLIPWPSASIPARGTWLKNRYQMFMHGGVLLFNFQLSVGTDLHAYRTSFNSENDQFNGLDAYHGINTHIAADTDQMFRTKPRWSISVMTDGRLLIAETPGMTIHEFAQAVKQVQVRLNPGTSPPAFATPTTSIMFDGGSHQGFHAAEKIEDIIGVSPNVINPQLAQRNGTICHFGVFEVNNVAIRKIGDNEIKKDYVTSDLIRMALNNTIKQIEVKIAARRSDHFKKTEKVEVSIRSHKLLGIPNPPSGAVFKKDFTGNAIRYDTDLSWQLSEVNSLVVAEWSSMDPVGVAVQVESFANNNGTFEVISSSFVSTRVVNGFLHAFALDDSVSVINPTLINARNAAASLIGTASLLTSEMRAAIDPIHSATAEVSTLAVSRLPRVVQNWTSNLQAFQDSFPSLGGLDAVDYNKVLTFLYDQFDSINTAGKQKSVYLFIATDHQGGALRDSFIRPLVGRNVRVHCIVFGAITPVNRAFLKKIAKDTGGYYGETLSPQALLNEFDQAFVEERGGEIPRTISFQLAAGGSRQEVLNLTTQDIAIIQLYAEKPEQSDFEVVLLRPDTGAPVDESNANLHPDISFVKRGNIVSILIFNPVNAVSPGSQWELTISRPAPLEEDYNFVLTVYEETKPPVLDPPPQVQEESLLRLAAAERIDDHHVSARLISHNSNTGEERGSSSVFPVFASAADYHAIQSIHKDYLTIDLEKGRLYALESQPPGWNCHLLEFNFNSALIDRHEISHTVHYMALDKTRNSLWCSLYLRSKGGQLVRFDLDTNEEEIFLSDVNRVYFLKYDSDTDTLWFTVQNYSDPPGHIPRPSGLYRIHNGLEPELVTNAMRFGDRLVNITSQNNIRVLMHRTNQPYMLSQINAQGEVVHEQEYPYRAYNFIEWDEPNDLCYIMAGRDSATYGATRIECRDSQMGLHFLIEASSFNIREFHSVALSPTPGRIWISGRMASGKFFYGRASAGGVEIVEESEFGHIFKSKIM